MNAPCTLQKLRFGRVALCFRISSSADRRHRPRAPLLHGEARGLCSVENRLSIRAPVEEEMRKQFGSALYAGAPRRHREKRSDGLMLPQRSWRCRSMSAVRQRAAETASLTSSTSLTTAPGPSRSFHSHAIAMSSSIVAVSSACVQVKHIAERADLHQICTRCIAARPG